MVTSPWMLGTSLTAVVVGVKMVTVAIVLVATTLTIRNLPTWAVVGVKVFVVAPAIAWQSEPMVGADCDLNVSQANHCCVVVTAGEPVQTLAGMVIGASTRTGNAEGALSTPVSAGAP